MRRILFIIMIALLPMRGWMGEAMATSMAINEITTNTIAIEAINTPATSEFFSKNEMIECDMHKLQSHEVSNDESTANPSCTHCQACHATGLINTVKINSISSVHLAQPMAFSSQFASANLALVQKPPIL
jgi:excinuclease UvrABC ATPase subunit